MPDPEIMYYDAELDVPGSQQHNATADKLAEASETIAKRRSLHVLRDNPIWYFDPDSGAQKAFYGDAGLARTDDAETVVADQLLIMVEVVSTNDIRRERKDTLQQKRLNEANEVPEFALLFPELGDPRAFELYRLDENGKYELVPPDANGRIESATVPGLSFRVLPASKWRARGFKVEVYDRAELLVDAHTARLAKQRAEKRAAKAAREAADAKQQAADAKQQAADSKEKAATAAREAADAKQQVQRAEERAAALALKLRALGIDPDG
ncbi:MAG: Uma2 family endonuclease [Deltaproteobacteria bacterium]|nr:Uma2 family endonuclease [Deltaproteobacteria bacterium]